MCRLLWQQAIWPLNWSMWVWSMMHLRLACQHWRHRALGVRYCNSGQTLVRRLVSLLKRKSSVSNFWIKSQVGQFSLTPIHIKLSIFTKFQTKVGIPVIITTSLLATLGFRTKARLLSTQDEPISAIFGHWWLPLWRGSVWGQIRIRSWFQGKSETNFS